MSDRPTVITWNTGREYSKEGQKMAATWIGGYIHYMDFTRMLEGSIQARRFEYSSDEIKEIVMFCYDRNLGSSQVNDREVREMLKAYENVVDDIKRQQAFSG